MLDGTATIISGGATSLSVNFCNFDTSRNHTYALSFSMLSVPNCDAMSETLPTLSSLVAADGCTADACAVTVYFESALDWAIALQNNGVSNTLSAQLTAGGSSETVIIATFAPMAAAVILSGNARISVCATELDVTGLRFSTVASCNAALICRGLSSDTICTTELVNDAHVIDASCSGETCAGKVVLSHSLPCDGSTGDATSLIMGVTVASSFQSNLISVGNMIAPNFTIIDASGLDVGSSKVVLTTDTFCADSGIQLNVTVGPDIEDTYNEGVEVSSINSTPNGTVIVNLIYPLSSNLMGDDIRFSLSQCGVSASDLFVIENDFNDSTSSLTGSTEASQRVAESRPYGSISTQEDDSDSGLSGGIIVAIIIAAVALGGFIFEYFYHTRRQPKPLAEDSTVNNMAAHM